MAYTKYSLTPANNNAAPPDGAPEGMLPSAVNDTMRDMMAQIRDAGDGIRNGTYTMTAPVITGGSITGVALSGNTLTNPVITGGSINNTPIGASTANTGAFTNLAYTGTLTGGTGVINIGSGQFYKDASGNVGIGTSSPDTTGSGTNLTIQSGAAQTRLVLKNTASGTANGNGFHLVLDGNSTAFVEQRGNFPLAFTTNATERMRIDSSGNLLVGTTSATAMSSLVAAGQAIQLGGRTFIGTSSGGDSGMGGLSGSNETVIYCNATRSATITTAGITLVNSLAQKATGTAWTNPSDVRLKDDIQDYTKGLSELMKVKVKIWKYNGKGNTVKGSNGLGVIADEIMQVIPDSVNIFKAKLNAEDTELTDIKNFDATEITWLLVKAVQELKAELDAVKTELSTLKGN